MNTTLWKIADQMFSAWEMCGSIQTAFREACADEKITLNERETSEVYESVFDMIQDARREAGVK
jgi:hypothetical protein